jgi:hypothetical protein
MGGTGSNCSNLFDIKVNVICSMLYMLDKKERIESHVKPKISSCEVICLNPIYLIY